MAVASTSPRQGWARRVLVAVLAVVATTALPGVASAAAATSPPTLRLVPITGTSVPFGALVAGATPGVTEQEYLLRGRARTFSDAGATGETPAYVTRLLVRRPEHFSGTVVVELLNASAGFEVEPMWDFQRESLARRGIGWVGVTYAPSALAFLPSWNPQRYAALAHDPAAPSQVWDIIRQVGSLLHDSQGQQLFAGTHISDELLAGYSSAAVPVTTWIQHFGHTHSPYAGYLVGAGYGEAEPLSADPNSPPLLGTIPAGLREPTVRVDTDTDLVDGSIRQADGPNLRTWEVAGGSHIDGQLAARFSEMWGRDLGLPEAATQCVDPPSPLRVGAAMDAAREAILRWARGGAAAPHAPRIRTDANGAIVRDGDGNALGGLRLPTIEVPTGTLSPTNVPANESDLAQFCVLLGSFHAFDATHLAALYPHPGTYVDRVTERARRLVEQDFLLPEDANAIIRVAARSGI